MASVRAKVTFDYNASQEDELTLAVGDIVTNIDQLDGGWWEGEIDGNRGLFPENFVAVIEDEPVLLPEKPALEPSKPSLPKAKVTFDYQATEEDELDLKEGDIVEVIDQDDEGWWQGICGGKKGMFPSNFVELIKVSENLSPVSTILPKEHPPEKKLANNPIALNEEIPQSHALTQSAPAEDVDAKKPKPGGMGFAISSADLFKTKLRPVSMVDDVKKPASRAEEPKRPVPPLARPDAEEPVSKKRDPPDGGPMKRIAPAPPKEDVHGNATEEKYRVIFDYKPENDDEIALKRDDIVIVTDKDVCEGWWEGTCNGSSGVFPNNFVEPCPATSPATAPATAPATTPASSPATSEDTSKLPRKPLLPHAAKGPALPAREAKERVKDVPEPVTSPPVNPSVPPPSGKKPILPEHKKPMLPEAKKPALPELKKPDSKRPPPPGAKNKPVPPKPTEKPSGEANATGDSIKNKLNAAIGAGVARIPSIGKKPVPPQPNGFVRTSSQSIKRPVPVPQPEQKPVAVKQKTEVANNATDVKKEEKGFEWDAPSTAQVLSNVNKDRVKGPGKALPTKYNQNKEKEDENIEQPPWKKEIAQKKKDKVEEHSLPKQKSSPEEQPNETKPSEESKPVKQSEEQKSSSTEQHPRALHDNDVIISEMRIQLKNMEEKMGNMEKKLMKHIEILTNDLDGERKERATLQIEVDRLKKQVNILQGQ